MQKYIIAIIVMAVVLVGCDSRDSSHPKLYKIRPLSSTITINADNEAYTLQDFGSLTIAAGLPDEDVYTVWLGSSDDVEHNATTKASAKKVEERPYITKIRFTSSMSNIEMRGKTAQESLTKALKKAVCLQKCEKENPE